MKTKKVLLFISVILIIFIVSLSLVYAYTDVFKTSSQKFWKYSKMNTPIIEMFNNESMQSIKNRRSSNAYEVHSNLNIVKSNKSYVVTANTSAENSSDITTEVDLKCNNEDIINFAVVRKSNIIAFKLDELANGFIGIKNNQIQKLASEAGVEDTSSIPDSINWTSLIDLLYIQPSDAKYFTETFAEVVRNYTTENNYSEVKTNLKIGDTTHFATGYKLTLTGNETKNVAKQILIHAKDDDARLINFISSRLKLLNLPKKYTDYDAIKNQIDKLITQVDSIESDDSRFLDIIVYVENNRVLQVNIKIKDSSIFAIIPEENGRSVNIWQDSRNDYLNESSNKILNYIGNIEQITISNEIADNNNSSTMKFYAKFYNDLSIDYNSKITIGTSGEKNVEFEETPRVILNEMDNDKLKQTYEKIVYGLKKIYENKKLKM